MSCLAEKKGGPNRQIFKLGMHCANIGIGADTISVLGQYNMVSVPKRY